ncbi:gas vesicle protein GvpM [Halegenticoccus tardaugens]|uniref:gas vesicle protein GvpM n=1 Tax=Halegenticoccus tardaugens TaxID=2071624 RepID=UPI003742717F
MRGMEPARDTDDVLVDLLDVLLERGAVVEADVVITVADVPLVGLKLRAALAGMTTMTEYGIFEEWDVDQRRRRRERSSRIGAGSRPNPKTDEPGRASRRVTTSPGDEAPTRRPDADVPDTPDVAEAVDESGLAETLDESDVTEALGESDRDQPDRDEPGPGE